MEQPAAMNLKLASVLSLAIKVIGAVLSYLMIVVFARLLTPEEYGRFATGLNSAIILAALGGFGFSTGIMRFWPKYIAEHDAARAKGAMLAGYVIVILGGIGILFATFVCALILPLFGVTTDIGFLSTIAAMGLVIGISDYSNNLLRAQGSVIFSMLPRDVLWRVLSPAFAYLLAREGLALSGTVSLIISCAVLLALNIGQVISAFSRLGHFGAVSTHWNLNGAWRQHLPFWFAAFTYTLIQQFDVVIVGALLSKADAGAYFAAQKTAQLLGLVLIAGGLATAPTMAKLYHSGQNVALQALCRKLSIAIVVVTTSGYLFLMIAGKIMLGFFDPSFVAAYPLLLIIGFGALVDAISGPNSYLMQMTSYEKDYLKIMVVCYACVLIAQFLLIPRFGSLGAAIASSLGVVMWNLWSITVLRRKARLDPSLLSFLLKPLVHHRT